MRQFFFILALLLYSSVFSQNVGISSTVFTPDASAGLEVQFTDKGVLIPRVALTSVNDAATIATPANALLVYNLGTGGLSPAGFYYNSGTSAAPVWVRFSSTADAWMLLGNAGTVNGTNFLGTTDNVELDFRTNNIIFVRLTTKGQLEIMNTGHSVFIGEQAGESDDLGNRYNVAVGYQSLFSNTNGHYNTAVGTNALSANINGQYNTALGAGSMNSNTVGTNNTAVGHLSMGGNINGVSNTAFGSSALFTNSAGSSNTAFGSYSLYLNTIGNQNTAGGYYALYNNTNGVDNTVFGANAMYLNTNGNRNLVMGSNAMRNATTGNDHNVALGYFAMYGAAPACTGSFENIAIGTNSLGLINGGDFNISLGPSSLYSNTTGTFNFASGYYAMYNGTSDNDYNIALGREAMRGTAAYTAADDNIAIGREVMYSISGGDYNIATGYRAMFSNTTSSNNISSGYFAMYNGTSGNDNNIALGLNAMRGSAAYINSINNVAVGVEALYNINDGDYNTALGHEALLANTSASYNVGLGFKTFFFNQTGEQNVGIGSNAGYGAAGANFSNCVFIGANTYPTVARTNVVMLGSSIVNAQCVGDNQVLLGNTAVSQIRAQVAGITVYSDSRFKSNVKNDVAGLDFIMRLKPVTYNENPEILHQIWGTPDSLQKQIDHTNIKNTRFIGFLAQDVEKAAQESGFTFPGIDIPKNENEVYTLRYTDFIMPLVKATQEQQDIIEEQEKEIKTQEEINRQQQTEIEELKKMVKELQLQIKAE